MWYTYSPGSSKFPGFHSSSRVLMRKAFWRFHCRMADIVDFRNARLPDTGKGDAS